MRIAHRLLPGFIPLVAGTITWWGLSDTQREAAWIEVHAAPTATTGTPFPVHVTLIPAKFPWGEEPMLIAVHLHGRPSRQETNTFLSAAQPQLIETTRAELQFNPVVPRDKTSGPIFLLVYASPTGGWEDRVAAAVSAEFPLRPPMAEEDVNRLQRMPVYSRDVGYVPIRRDVASIRMVMAFGWLTCGWILWRRPKGGIRTRDPRQLLLPLLAVLVAVWELLPLEDFLGERARAFAAAHDWYDVRGGFQHLTTVAIVVAAVTTIMLLLRRARGVGHFLPLIGLTLHGGVTLAGFLSLHRLDALLAARFFSLPLIQILQLGALFLALIGMVIVLRSDRPVDHRGG